MEFDNDSLLSVNLTNEITTVADYSEIPIKALVPGWSRTVMAIYIIIAMTIGVPGNGFVLFVLSKLKRKTSTDWFIIFISMCDIISLLVRGTLLLNTTVDLWKIVHSQFLCKFDLYVTHFVFLQSALFITCVGVDRYVKTCKPHSVFFTPKSALICCLVIIIVSAIFNISHLYTSKVNIYGDCTLDSSKTTFRISLYIVLFIFFTICSIALGVMYSKIAMRIRNRMKVGPIDSKNHKNDQKSKTHKRCFRLFSGYDRTSDALPMQRVNVFVDKKESTKTSGMVDDDITVKNRSNASSEHGIFNVSDNKGGEVHQQACGLNEGASTSVNSAAQKNQTMRSTGIKKHEEQMTRQINRTTKIMGAITLVFIISSVVPTIVAASLPVSQEVKKNPVIRVIIYFLLRLYIISFFANPLFYMWLSSNFRKKIIEILKICKK